MKCLMKTKFQGICHLNPGVDIKSSNCCRRKISRDVKNYRRYFIAVIIVGLVLFLSTQAAWTANSGDSCKSPGVLSVEYFEDKDGILKLEQVEAKEFSNNFRLNGSSFLTFGNSRSVWWIRLMGVYPFSAVPEQFLTIVNASVQDVILYVPCVTNGVVSYMAKKSGWQYKEYTDDESFLYPAFKLPDNTDRSRYIYIRIQSVYSHNYEINLLKAEEFNALRQQNLIFAALLLGILLAMLLLNLILFISLRDDTYLRYVVYIASMLLFQAALLGVPSIFPGGLARLLVMNTCAISCVMMVASISFVRAFLDTPHNDIPKHDFVLKLLAAASLFDIIPMLVGWRFVANTASNYLAVAIAITILSTAIISLRKGVRQAKYFLVAWILLIMGAILFIMRSWGVMPNNFLARHFPLIASALEAILINIALVDRARSIVVEKQSAVNMLALATEEKRSAEIAFLQAQIKPHFLYNSLSVIAALTIKDPPRAKELLYNLADYLRGSFNFESINGTIMLPEEMATVRAYLAIEKERFRDKLRIEYDIDETIRISIPLLTIQPLVENALRHGIFKKPEGGFVQISVKSLNEFVVIKVTDDGVGIPNAILVDILNDDWNSSSVGLKNINKRLLLHYGQGLELESIEGCGTAVTIRIPKISGGKSNDKSNYS